MDELLSRALVIVTGKGGVGKSTVAAALAVAAQRRGRRALVVEVAGRNDVRRMLTDAAAGPPHVERRVGERVHHLSLDPRRALAEYLREQLPVGPLASLLVHDRTFGLLAAAAPGLAELVTIGKVWRVADGDRYDVVVLDAPPTGHVVGLLHAPRTFAALAARGPVADQARGIDAFLVDPARTAVVTVATAQEMAVNEALELRATLRDRLGIGVGRVVVDRLLPDRFSVDDVRALEAAPPSRPCRAALFAASLARGQQAQLRRLEEAMAPVSVDTLPLLFAAAIGAAEVRTLEQAWTGAHAGPRSTRAGRAALL